MGWLVLNGMRSEKIQFNLLSEQRLANIWRKNRTVSFVAMLVGASVVSPQRHVIVPA
jgi:hypothetical protein